MSDIPSDFDPSVLFSDYLPPTQLEECPSLPSPPEESHSDELEAIELVIEETRQRYNKEGVVIRHRQLNPEPAFRSSSLPPGEFSWGLWLGGVRVYSVLTRQFLQKLPLGTVRKDRLFGIWISPRLSENSSRTTRFASLLPFHGFLPFCGLHLLPSLRRPHLEYRHPG